MLYTRRDFGKLALAGLPATTLLLDAHATFGSALAKPNSKWAGVQVGMNVPYNFSTGNYTSGDEILDRCVKLGISGVELRAQPVELFLGSPAAIAGAAAAAAAGGRRGGAPPGAAAAPGAVAAGEGGALGAGPARAGGGAAAPVAGAEASAGAGGGARAGGGGRAALTPEQQAAQTAAADETRKWRMGVSMDKVKQFRKTYEDAGVLIEIVKWDGIFSLSDDEIDYCFEVSKALGANALSSEISIGQTKHLGQFADKHKMAVGYHGHTAVTPAIWEAAFAEATYNFANLDLGHFVAGNNTSPVPFLKQHHDRITHVHVKDRKLNNGPNVPLGQGDTPVKEVLQLMRDNKWTFQATIEFEIPGPAGPDGRARAWTMEERMTEMAKCVQYCKDCLLS